MLYNMSCRVEHPGSVVLESDYSQPAGTRMLMVSTARIFLLQKITNDTAPHTAAQV